jgi:hypothetical protein
MEPRKDELNCRAVFEHTENKRPREEKTKPRERKRKKERYFEK